MNEKPSHPLKFLSGFEDCRPDAYHHVDVVYAEEWIRGEKILNIGCWTGSFEAISSGLPQKAFALDQDINALGIARVAHPAVSFVNGNLFELPFQSNSFEVILLFTVFEHLGGQEQEALRQTDRVLVPTGNSSCPPPQPLASPCHGHRPLDRRPSAFS